MYTVDVFSEIFKGIFIINIIVNHVILVYSLLILKCANYMSIVNIVTDITLKKIPFVHIYSLLSQIK